MERVRAVEFTGNDRVPIGAVCAFACSLVGCHYILSPEAVDHHIIKTVLAFAQYRAAWHGFGNKFVGVHMVWIVTVLDIDPAQPLRSDAIISLSECAPGLADPRRIIEQFNPHPDGYLACRVEFLRNSGARHAYVFR